ncbi:DEAD/DEAH box helicase [Methanocorpusculum sp. GPch4]|uniref:DEAD/DEAH box helicase n=1 Tax=Methanocorpusculum sp. GPch4 TaxID=2527877 RepID=UPI001432E797|nr:DEAD/DEAH box helicase [Methanocorpusculum sp. GPch4]
MTLSPGIYEQLISTLIQKDINTHTETGSSILTRPIDPAEAKHILSQYLTEIIEKSLPLLKEKNDDLYLQNQIHTANQIIELLAQTTNDPDINFQKISGVDQLIGVLENSDQNQLIRPETSISISTLFTGSKLEPSMMNELKKEILSSDKIDMLVSFIKWSGLRLIIEELKAFTKTHPLRIITTSYMGATDLKAIKELHNLPNTEIKISYETRTTRLHAKSYIFHRHNGFGTAYVGSSNISNAALGTGLEWNVKLTEKDMAHVLKIITATFDTYWNNPDFETYTNDREPDLRKALKAEKMCGEHNEYLFQIEPYPFQKEILEKLQTERTLHNRWRNLIVAATGTGKTVVSAFDYRRHCLENPNKPNRLLFIAHRTEILKQSLACFRGVLRNQNFGELFDGNNTPENYDYLFLTIQTFQSKEFQTLIPPDYYDVIVVDEFHHAAAKSYQTLLTYFTPKILLGLTATPERMDGHDITEYFGGVTAAEIRLPEAINRGLLSPFQYFCVTDPVDLSTIKFEYGKYDVHELEEKYIGNKERTRTILDAVDRYVTDISQVIGLGFCVSRKHAQEAAEHFTTAGIPSTYLDAESSEEERQSAKASLQKKVIHFIFTVNLYNEGVDIPEVNTILFLRPTESLTVFLQQLGRGLRLSEGKDVLTVLDFVGHSHQKYNFEQKFRSLLDKTRHSMKYEMEHGFSSLPSGCFIQMEREVMKTVLENIQRSLPNKRNILNKLQYYQRDTGEVPTLKKFIQTYDLELADVYQHGMFWQLCIEAGVSMQTSYPNERVFGKAMIRLTHINSRRWINFLLRVFRDGGNVETKEDVEMLTMLYYTFKAPNLPKAAGFNTPNDFVRHIREMPLVCAELVEFLEIRYEQIEFLDSRIELGYPSALDLYCSYSRDEIVSGLGWINWDSYAGMLEGVRYIDGLKTVIMLVTLQKSEKFYSPTTMYEDYVISEELFHWQSQNITSPESKVGQRYIHHEKMGISILLFVRQAKSEGTQTMPYVFLGRVHYVSHEGSKPMSIVWRLEKKIPMRLYMDLADTKNM